MGVEHRAVGGLSGDQSEGGLSKPRVLIFVDYYLPGFKAGGPIASVSRMVADLRDRYDIRIFTRDRDLGDETPYPSVTQNQWNDVNGTAVYYASPDRFLAAHIESIAKDSRPDLIYLNSYFSVLSRTVLTLAKKKRLGNAKIALAPRGEFSMGALALKAVKKKAFLRFARMAGLTNDVVWHVSSEHEQRDVLRAIGRNSRTIVEAPGLPSQRRQREAPVLVKESGSVSFAWLSRISPKKNLLGAIQMLGQIQREAALTIYGPVEDRAYWQECQDAIRFLPRNVEVVYGGGLPPEIVVSTLSKHHFFLFPTFGENFGHVVPEALSAGCPILLSDQTPWLDLNERSAGWVMPLQDELAWRECIQSCIDMGNERYQKMRAACQSYIEEVSDRQLSEGPPHLFEIALAS